MVRRRRIRRVTRRVSFAASSAQVREDRMILLLLEGLVQVKRGTPTCRRVRNPTAGRSTYRRVTWSGFTPGYLRPGQESATAGGAASMMVIVNPSSSVRREKRRRRGSGQEWEVTVGSDMDPGAAGWMLKAPSSCHCRVLLRSRPSPYILWWPAPRASLPLRTPYSEEPDNALREAGNVIMAIGEGTFVGSNLGTLCSLTAAGSAPTDGAVL
jgi:hypothetical protein